MRRYILSVLICAALLVIGCGAGTPDSAASEKAKSTAVTEEAAGGSGTVKKAADPAEAAPADSTGALSAGTAETAQKAEAGEAVKEEPQAPAEEETAEAAETKEEKEAGAAAEEKKAPEKEKTQKKDLKKESKEKHAGDYIPEGFTPYGNYVLVYDSGYEVKTRLSKAGLTYYYGSEEFLFTLDKDLPDMTREVAHILFNNAGPMDPANTEGEEFPFGEGFVIYINLDDGSYYEVYSSSLDLDGRVFARDIFELFRQKWEGAF